MLAVDVIKIDRFFIQNLTDDPRDAAIVRAVIAMAHSLGIKVVAEGVESEAQMEFLRNLRWPSEGQLRCDMVQGFLLARPLPAAQVPSLLARPGTVGG